MSTYRWRDCIMEDVESTFYTQYSTDSKAFIVSVCAGLLDQEVT